MWSGSCMVRPRPRCSGVNKHVNLGVCLFLTGVRKVTESSDTSTPNGFLCSTVSLSGPPRDICTQLYRYSCTIFEPTCAYARWALMHRFLYVVYERPYVRMSVCLFDRCTIRSIPCILCCSILECLSVCLCI